MNFKRERDFLKNLCKGHIRDLINEVGWTPTQCDIIRYRYLEFKSVTSTCLKIGLSETEYRRKFDQIAQKLRSYMLQCKDEEFKNFYLSYKDQ